MVYDALEAVKLRSDFYRDGYRKVVIALLCAIVAIIGLIVVITYLVASKPKPKYFAATDSGRIIPLIALNQPNLSDNALLSWASEALISLYSYDFLHYKKTFQENKKYFTSRGWRSFMDELERTKTLSTVKDKKLIVSAVLNGAPIVSNRYLLGGRYTWEVQVPFQVTYQGTETFSQDLRADLKIQRVSTLDNPFGVGITESVIQQK